MTCCHFTCRNTSLPPRSRRHRWRQWRYRQFLQRSPLLVTVMSWAPIFNAVLLSLQWHCCSQQPTHTTQQQTASYEELLLEDRGQLLSGNDPATAYYRRHRSDRGTVKVSTPSYDTPFTHVTLSVNENTGNTQIPLKLTKDMMYAKEISTFWNSSRSSRLLITCDASIVTSRSTVATIDDKYPSTDEATNTATAVKWETGQNETQTIISENNETRDTSDTTMTQDVNCLNTLSMTPNETFITSDYATYKIARLINLCAQPIIAVVGVVGNTISMFVMFQTNNRHTSFGIYLGILAVSDTLALCANMAYWLMRLLSPLPLRDIDCQIRGWLINSLQMNGLFIILCLTLDRLISVRFPLKAIAWCDARRATFVSGAIFGVVWLLNVPYLLYAHVESSNMCAMGWPGSVVSFVYPWMVVCVGFVTPFVLLVSMNAVIAMGIRNRLQYQCKYAPERRQQRDDPIELRDTTASDQQSPAQNLSRDNKQIRPLSSRDRNAIVTLFLVSFTFLLFVTPHYVHIATFSMPNLIAKPSQHANYTLFFQISRQLYSMNNACNFFLYCLSGTKFRSEVAKLFFPKAHTG